jgi:hypothetical protein
MQKVRRHPPPHPKMRVRLRLLCRHPVSGSVSLPAWGCFSPFPHGTGSLSVTEEYLGLEGGPPTFRQGFTCPALLEDLRRPLPVRGCHPLWRAFPDASGSSAKATGLVRVRSPLLAESLLMSFPPATEMFQFAGFASSSYGFTEGYRLSGGLPHSDIPGSKSARLSPGLFAACHVLHRLSVPRHPPDALLVQSSPTSNPKRARPARACQRACQQARTLRTRAGSRAPGLDTPASCIPMSIKDAAAARPRASRLPDRPACRALRSRLSLHDFRYRTTEGRMNQTSSRPPSPNVLPRARLAKVRPTSRAEARTGTSVLRPSLLCPLELVGLGRFERPTSRLSGVRSNQLSYRPKIRHQRSELKEQARYRRHGSPPLRLVCSLVSGLCVSVSLIRKGCVDGGRGRLTPRGLPRGPLERR